MNQTKFSIKNKYQIVGEILERFRGSVLDVGSRDKVLRNYLSLDFVKYFSADMGEGHDFQINLEEIIQLPDGHFDCVVALDVLEHVGNIHQSFHELARLSKRSFIIALPNMATLSKRWSYLTKGYLGTKKYDLYPEHQGDRHRWLTVYPEIYEFVEYNSRKAGFKIDTVYEEYEKTLFARFGLLLANIGLTSRGYFSDRCIFVMSRR